MDALQKLTHIRKFTKFRESGVSVFHLTAVIRRSNNVQVIRNCFVTVPSLLSRFCDTGTNSWASFLSPSRCSPPTISAILMMPY